MHLKTRTFKKRRQPLKREKYGKMESKSDVLNRVNEEKEYQSKIREIEEQISKKDDQEFYFKMYSTFKKDGKLYSNKKISKTEKQTRLNYLNNEIKRIEKILQNNLANKKCTKIDLETGKVYENILEDSEMSEDYETYFEKLISVKKLLEKK